MIYVDYDIIQSDCYGIEDSFFDEVMSNYLTNNEEPELNWENIDNLCDSFADNAEELLKDYIEREADEGGCIEISSDSLEEIIDGYREYLESLLNEC